MGIGSSQPAKKLPIEYRNVEFQEESVQWRNSSNQYVKWSSVPMDAKADMKKYVYKFIKYQENLIGTSPSIYVHGWWALISSNSGNSVGIPYYHAIYEVLQETGCPYPYILTSDGRGWIIHFIYPQKQSQPVPLTIQAPAEKKDTEERAPATQTSELG